MSKQGSLKVSGMHRVSYALMFLAGAIIFCVGVFCSNRSRSSDVVQFSLLFGGGIIFVSFLLIIMDISKWISYEKQCALYEGDGEKGE